MEKDRIFYDHLEYFTAINYDLWPFVIVCCHFVYFPRFGMFEPRKIWQPWNPVQHREAYVFSDYLFCPPRLSIHLGPIKKGILKHDKAKFTNLNLTESVIFVRNGFVKSTPEVGMTLPVACQIC
jgi:hypothetical protein